tara:strand:- start:737 stop:934 length:198 start_codon:yes stop_codon:yes gene_type:complete
LKRGLVTCSQFFYFKSIKFAEKSIIEFRINSIDLGIMMPELSRKIVHTEGLELIRTWIKEMDLLG